MTYTSQFTGPQVDSAIKAVLNGMIDATVFRARISDLADNVMGLTSDIPVTPITVDLQGEDPLLLINENGQSTSFYIDLPAGQLLPEGSTSIPIRDEHGDPVDLTAGAGTPVFIEGSRLFDRFRDFSQLIELQNVSIANLGNSIIMNNSVGAVGTLTQDYLEAEDITALEANTNMDLEEGDVLSLLDTASFEFVEVILDSSVNKGVGVTLNLSSPISGTFLENQPLGFGGEAFISSFQLDKDRISLLSARVPSIGAIADLWPTSIGNMSIPVSNLSVDLEDGETCDVYGPGGEKLGSFEVLMAEAGDNTISLASSLLFEIPANSYLHLSPQSLVSQIELTPEQINLIVTGWLSESFVTIESDRVIMETPAFGNSNWFADGSFNPSTGAITDFAAVEAAWVITGAAHFQFQQNSENYFRSKGQGFEFRGQVFGSTGVIIDEGGYVDDSIDSGPIKSGAVVASKLYKAAQNYSTDLSIVPHEPPSNDTIRIEGTYIQPSDGEAIDITANWGNPYGTLTLTSSRNYIFYDFDTQDIEVSTDPDVLSREDILFLATAFQGLIMPVEGEDDEIETPTIFFPVNRSTFGSDFIAAKSIAADKLRANCIKTIHLEAASIVGDHISALTTIQIGQGDPGGEEDGGVVLISGTGSNRILSGEVLQNIIEDPTNANFRVTNQGVLHAFGAHITGTINAATGSISGPFNIGGTLTMGLGGEIQSDPNIWGRAMVINPQGAEFGAEEDCGIRLYDTFSDLQKGRMILSNNVNTFYVESANGAKMEIVSTDTLYCAAADDLTFRSIGGNIILEALPVTAPSGSGKVWNDGGTLKITS